MAAKVRKDVVPDVAARKQTGHALDYVNVAVQAKTVLFLFFAILSFQNSILLILLKIIE